MAADIIVAAVQRDKRLPERVGGGGSRLGAALVGYRPLPWSSALLGFDDGGAQGVMTPMAIRRASPGWMLLRDDVLKERLMR